MSNIVVNYQLLGKMVREVRKKCGLSQAELADMIDVSPQFMSKIENGKKQASLQTVFRIARSLNVSIDLLVGNNFDESDTVMNLVYGECDDLELEIIRQMAIAMKDILRKNLGKIQDIWKR